MNDSGEKRINFPPGDTDGEITALVSDKWKKLQHKLKQFGGGKQTQLETSLNSNDEGNVEINSAKWVFEGLGLLNPTDVSEVKKKLEFLSNKPKTKQEFYDAIDVVYKRCGWIIETIIRLPGSQLDEVKDAEEIAGVRKLDWDDGINQWWSNDPKFPVSKFDYDKLTQLDMIATCTRLITDFGVESNSMYAPILKQHLHQLTILTDVRQFDQLEGTIRHLINKGGNRFEKQVWTGLEHPDNIDQIPDNNPRATIFNRKMRYGLFHAIKERSKTLISAKQVTEQAPKEDNGQTSGSNKVAFSPRW